MSRSSTVREAWQPETKDDREAVLRELQAIVSSPHFCNSKRYPALLRHIVENTLAGKTDLLKERTLGVEVFDRPPTYDTNADTVVRYTAGEVRKRLLLYYSEHSPQADILISLPAGSYIAEFLHEHNGGEGSSTEGGTAANSSASYVPNSAASPDPFSEGNQPGPVQLRAGVDPAVPSGAVQDRSGPAPGRARIAAGRLIWLAVGVAAVTCLLAGLGWKYSHGRPRTAVDEFWAPVLSQQGPVLLCTGSVVFAQDKFSGVVTAGKDIDYPFVSMQIVSAVAQLSSLLERSGASTELVSSASIPLTDLRDHSLILLGGYNNQWTMRLLDPLRFHFTQEPVESIVDKAQPQAHWSRDRSVPYSSADDYALVARFRDPTTGSWVVVLAGLGRNGTEAAAHFVASPDYVQLLKNTLGKNWGQGNIEALLKVSVIDGKTGAPSILAAYAW